jgi:hypothetical protein
MEKLLHALAEALMQEVPGQVPDASDSRIWVGTDRSLSLVPSYLRSWHETARKKGSLYCKVSEKGAISVYGLQRMPVTLYVEQWQRLLDFADQIRQFIKEHDTELRRKQH